MNTGPTRVLPTVAALAVGCLLAGTGCARTQQVVAAPAASSTVDAAAVLRAFDAANSAATTTGDENLLRTQEVEPALSFSIAAIRAARRNGRSQPAFQHRAPAFAIAPDGSCFVAVAALRLAGEELDRRDVSIFVHDAGGWRLSHHVLLGPETPADATAISPTAVSAAAAMADHQDRRLATEVHARSTGTSTPHDTITPSPLLDRRLAGGWAIYQQQLASRGLSVTRTLDAHTAAPCAAEVAGHRLAFLTLTLTDTIKAAGGRRTPAVLSPDSPDGVALGLRTDLRGRSVQVRRTEVFLVSVAAGGAGPDAVLGLNDAATSATATG